MSNLQVKFPLISGQFELVPFAEDAELVHGLSLDQSGGLTPTSGDSVPGQPLIPLDGNSVRDFLDRELSTKRLNEMYHRLWLLSSRNNISPLHHQALRGRQILITERPDLHLVWYYDQIFIKPIPRCLLNHAFFKTYVSRPAHDSSIHLAANGFLRTYTKLIVHESDFNAAVEKGLLPKDENITWETWCNYIRGFRNFEDDEVTKRYHYGELRLTRLNFYSKLFFYGWNYFDTYTQYGWFFARFVTPYLLVFGSITVILAAMQTAITADSESTYKDSAYRFSTFSIYATSIGLALCPLLYLFYQFRELAYAVLH